MNPRPSDHKPDTTPDGHLEPLDNPARLAEAILDNWCAGDCKNVQEVWVNDYHYTPDEVEILFNYYGEFIDKLTEGVYEAVIEYVRPRLEAYKLAFKV